MVGLEPYNATSTAQGVQWVKKTKQIEINIPNIRKRKPEGIQLCMQISTKAVDDFGYPFFEPVRCNSNEWSQQWTFVPIMDGNNRQKCAKSNERGKLTGRFNVFFSLKYDYRPTIYLFF